MSKKFVMCYMAKWNAAVFRGALPNILLKSSKLQKRYSKLYGNMPKVITFFCIKVPSNSSIR